MRVWLGLRILLVDLLLLTLLKYHTPRLLHFVILTFLTLLPTPLRAPWRLTVQLLTLELRSILIHIHALHLLISRFRQSQALHTTTSIVLTSLSGNWEWSLRTADYWRHHFEIPLVHGHQPFHNVPIETTAPTEVTRFIPTIQDLAQQLSITLRAAMASGEINDTWRALEDMSFRDAIETLQAGTSLPSE